MVTESTTPVREPASSAKMVTFLKRKRPEKKPNKTHDQTSNAVAKTQKNWPRRVCKCEAVLCIDMI